MRGEKRIAEGHSAGRRACTTLPDFRLWPLILPLRCRLPLRPSPHIANSSLIHTRLFLDLYLLSLLWRLHLLTRLFVMHFGVALLVVSLSDVAVLSMLRSVGKLNCMGGMMMTPLSKHFNVFSIPVTFCFEMQATVPSVEIQAGLRSSDQYSSLSVAEVTIRTTALCNMIILRKCEDLSHSPICPASSALYLESPWPQLCLEATEQANRIRWQRTGIPWATYRTWWKKEDNDQLMRSTAKDIIRTSKADLSDDCGQSYA